MPRFFFDVRDVDGFHRDPIGDEFDSFEEARQQAQALLPDILRRELPDGEYHIVVCDVRNADDRVIYRGEITYRGTLFRI
jgi:hypothetical protein